MTPQPSTWNRPRYIVLGVVVLLLVGVATAVAKYGLPDFHKKMEAPEAAKGNLSVELVKEKPNTIYVPEEVRKSLEIDGTYQIKAMDRDKDGPLLVMSGSTALDPNGISRIRTRFNAKITKIEEIKVGTPASAETIPHEYRTGDRIVVDDKKPTILAEVWSVEVGARKSDLADAIVQLRLDEQRLKERADLWKSGNLPLDLLNQTRRDVIVDQNNLDRAERTLVAWEVPPEEIKEVREAAEAAFKNNGIRDRSKEALWARSAVIAPRSGIIVERNASVGEFIADTTVNLFTIADMRRMLILANLSGDQTTELDKLKKAGDRDPEKQLRWTIKIAGVDRVYYGPIDEIGYILDPNQKTAVVKGYIDNPDHVLRAGQFVRAEVRLPPPENVVEVPLTALAEDGRQSFVFVQPDPSKHEYTMRRVQVVQRFENKAYVRSKLSEEESTSLTKEERALGLVPRQSLLPEERLLTSGVLELRGALEDLASKTEEKKDK